MVNVKDKACEQSGCEKQPVYNVRGATTGRFCAEHKEPEMVNVKDKTCETSGCTTRARYAPLGHKATHCAPHRQKGMISHPCRTCQASCCRQLGTHEAEGKRYCEVHMPVGAQNLGMASCSVCGLEDILHDGKCDTCNPIVVQIRLHAKENRIRDVLTVAGISFVHDKMLEGSICGRERPDFQIDCGTHFVYVEVDEHQHQSYACECEQTRMVNLVEVRGMPVRWIRYNPDMYEVVKGQRQAKAEQREKRLVEYVMWAMKHTPQENENMSEVLYLFYNRHDTKHQEWMKLI